ncbi:MULTISPECIES: MFS transporter [Pseudonocardia]|uniref:Inner membrane transport protein RhmT n=2 Tax=Pseudonocardia TaxID=1847 RepID=A0A1Y2N1V5_PSEAH|nr:MULTISPECIES: MFS transporter [Pseudonocardia]OSY41422.1 Inner membrane transport protein RhmT [Pseudonocardia autotrophica]TDN71379.1 sugar phosphate permease [Pseudonocardia autotrophica]BBG02056.1 MFS transporter [Pseudonocardia autotrophica]GEC24070.1 MFS transporter [Pseudonocardia saturnea]
MATSSSGPSGSSADAPRELLNSPHLESGIRKSVRRLMPMLVILYFVAFLDRTNIAFAEEGLQVDRGVSAGAFALGAGIFFIGYALFEIPSNLLLKKYGARFWLARIAITWGLVGAAFAFTTNDTMFIVLRFLLGVAEAGLFPGVIMFLAEWFPNRKRVQMFAIFYLAQPFSQMVGGPLSGVMISFGNRFTPFLGWQVMFFMQGMMAVVAGIVALFVLIDSPSKAPFLSTEEKTAMREVMEHENAVKDSDGPRGIVPAMLSAKVWYFTVIYFCLQIAVYGTTFYLPQQVSSLIGRDVGWEVGLVTAIPWAVGLFACYYIGRHADTLRRRRNWGTIAFAVTGTAILVSGWAGANGQALLGIAAITVAVSAFLCAGPISWSFPTAFLAGAAAATGIGLINSIGNLGGFVAPIMRTAINDLVPTDTGMWGVLSLGVLAFLAAAMTWGTRFFTARADDLLGDAPGAARRETGR